MDQSAKTREVLPGSPGLARSIFGAPDPEETARGLGAFCTAHIGSGVDRVFFCELRWRPPSECGCKTAVAYSSRRTHRVGPSLAYLKAMHWAQDHLFRAGFPRPRSAAAPVPFRARFVIENFVDEGEYADAHEPRVRRALARTLARLVRLAGEVSDRRGLEQGWRWPGPEELWPEPHNALFSFRATIWSARWIEEIAARAKEVVDGFDGGTVIKHADWSSKHLCFGED